jgi:hypothetical protein
LIGRIITNFSEKKQLYQKKIFLEEGFLQIKNA